MIKTDIAKEIVKKKSSTPLGSGTMMIATIAKIKATIVKSFARIIGSRYGAISAKIFLLDLAK